MKEAAFITDKGNTRNTNQDRVVLEKSGTGLFCAVADGMGGLEHGEIASSFVAARLKDWCKNKGLAALSPEGIVNGLYDEISYVNHGVVVYSRENGIKTGTTVTALYLRDSFGVVAYSGDTRLYCLREGKVQQLTEDETLYNYYEQYGDMPPEGNIERNKSVLVSYIGRSDNLSLSTRVLEVCPGDIYVLCSDGVYKYIDFSSRDIIDILRDYTAAEAVRLIASRVKEKGANDNLSIITVKC